MLDALMDFKAERQKDRKIPVLDEFVSFLTSFHSPMHNMMKSFVSSSLVVCLVTGSLLLSLTAQSTGYCEAMTRHNLLSEITQTTPVHIYNE